MSKKISAQMTYNGSDVDTVFAMLTDPNYVTAKNEGTGGKNVAVEVVPEGRDGVKIVVSRVLPAQIPGFAKKFVGETIDTTETDNWGAANSDDSRDGLISVDFGSAPIAINGTLRLESSGTGTVLKVDVEVKSGVPLVGGKLEGVAADQFQRAVNKEQEIGLEWLASS
ncbi:MAG: DUF2505 domain-containing protein [Candidatus Nanopelagicales bacterium]